MSGAVSRVVAALRAKGLGPRPSGSRWSCRCPAHDDRSPSLSIGMGDDGRALITCHAGCSVQDVCAALGLTPSDLFENDAGERGRGAAFPRRRAGEPCVHSARGTASASGNGQSGSQRDGAAYPTAEQAIAALELTRGRRTASWQYTNKVGEPVGYVVRWDRPGGGKDIRPVSLAPDGRGWVHGGIPARRPLYGLLDLLAKPPGKRVYVTEGEKAADAARSAGLTATTSPQGSSSAGKADWSPLAGHDVVILPDHDNAGERYAAEVARLASAAGAKAVRVVRLVDLWAGMPKGGDMADFVEHLGGDADAARTQVEALADKTAPEEASPEAAEFPGFRPFPLNALPEPVRRFVADGAEVIGCDPSYIALPMLSALASAIGNTHRIQLKRSWTEPAIVWTAIVGESGTMKTPAFKLALKAIRTRQERAFQEYARAVAAWRVDQLRYEAELAGWKKEAAKPNGEAGEPPQEPPQPIATRYIVSDTTTEALAPILLGNPRGVLLARDELAGWIGSFDRYAKAGKGGADMAHWLSMHNGEAMTIDRKTGVPPTISVPSASVSIAGGIQPGILERTMGPEHHESGLLARLLFAMPPRRAKRWTEAELDPATEAATAAVFDRLLGRTMEADPDSTDPLNPLMRPRLVPLSEDAKRAWRQFYNEHGQEQVDLSGDEAAAWSKLEGYAARLALVVHLTRWAAGDPAVPEPTHPVDAASILAGVEIARWFGNEARRVYAILSESEDRRTTRRVVEWIEQRGGAVTVRDLTHGMRAYREDSQAAERVLSTLVQAGMGSWESEAPGAKGGRPAHRFRLSSSVTVTATPKNAAKDAGYGDGDTRDTATNADDGWGEL